MFSRVFSSVIRLNLHRNSNVRLFKNTIKFFSSVTASETNQFYVDPCENLSQFLEVPLFGENEKPFKPTRQEMDEALKIFTPKRNYEIKFLTSFVELDKLPQINIPEVIFIGRSNVGKSSLLQSILKQVPNLKVKTSKKPGFTKTLNFFEVGRLFFLVDAPGYGFNQPKHFIESVESYLKQRKNLVRTFLLIDGRVGFTSLDYVALEMLEEFRIPYALILTKVDIASTSRQLVNLMDVMTIKQKFTSPSCFVQPFMISAYTGEGMGYLMAFIAYITGNLQIKNNY